MTRAFNFSAGPATLPESVLRRAQAEMLDWHGSGASIVEMSHRGAEFMSVAAEAEADLRRLLDIPDDYAVLFLSGGATTQQALIPLNFAAPGQRADYVVSGHWGKTAVKQAGVYVDVNIAASSEANGYRTLPARADWQLSPGAAYVHITANETIHGVEFRDAPDTGNVPLIADFSSSIASEPMDVRRYGVIYAGAQKNLGPVGIAVMIIRRDLLERSGQPRADIFDYRSHVARDSMLNTRRPGTGTWPGWCSSGCWPKAAWPNSPAQCRQGGAGVRRHRRLRRLLPQRGRACGTLADEHPVLPARCRTRRPFRRRRQGRWLAGAEGPKVVGGIRASLYNAMPLAGAEALVAFMADFQQRHG